MILFLECLQFWSHRYFIKTWFAVASSDAADLLLLSLKSCRQELTVKPASTFSTSHQRQEVALLDSELQFSEEHFPTGFTCTVLQHIYCTSDVFIPDLVHPGQKINVSINVPHPAPPPVISSVLIMFNKKHIKIFYF